MKTVIISLLSVLAISAGAQKLPNKQKQSLWAPADIKIDGNATEWKNQFQAYNKAVDLFYTVSNDDKYLYLTIRAKYQDIIDKILRGGITLDIKPESSKSNDDLVSITYPILEGTDMFMVTNKFASKHTAFEEAKDSLVNVNDLNVLFEAKEKLIAIKGIESITEPAISVYNETGIKTAALFDNETNFTYELAIPLKYLKLPPGSVKLFKYHVKVNEAPEISRSARNANVPPPPPVPMTTFATTDFWGDYTLATK